MIALLGASGHFGQAFSNYFQSHDIAFSGLSRQNVDYFNLAKLISWLKELKPEFVINAEGFTGESCVSVCEDRRTECLLANAVLPGIVREACERLDLPWGHVSSGSIYTGTLPNGAGFRETDPPNFTFRQNNCNFYAGCKALGEELLRGADRCYVWRIRAPFNHVDQPKNYLSQLLRSNRLVDVRESLSQLDEVIAACYDCWESRVDFGTYHLINGGSVSTRQVIEMMKRFDLTDRSFEFVVSDAEISPGAGRVPQSHCILNNTKALVAGLYLSPVEEALSKALQRWLPAG